MITDLLSSVSVPAIATGLPPVDRIDFEVGCVVDDSGDGVEVEIVATQGGVAHIWTRNGKWINPYPELTYIQQLQRAASDLRRTKVYRRQDIVGPSIEGSVAVGEPMAL